eukprot:CAMPEP_0119116116 /NCGR_PEP_ID=MMETSP1180-20130426/52106_1 /TAXON_ID=3052 ORGANISM="Chlamydomonas cf sp, Strain CCMP681" /NCGR_SAMPLE_ID=MMETSP1180 /ASSEMBLY_ACC=CAM_ASM_000741 /LENGTH=324 /DNA_ID=CAMNT_0007105231 /DNA_START=111 /DNA_END=1085 /DNA_ORIENTATION=-
MAEGTDVPSTVVPGTPMGTSPYNRVRTIGRGAFGEVFLAVNRATGEEVAIKCTSRRRDPTFLKYLEAEIMNQRVLRHPHVVELKEVFLVDAEKIGIVMEYAPGGSLFGMVQRDVRLSEDTSRWFFQQLCMTLDFCHERGVAHRDIKLENLLLKPLPGLALPLLKACDFGFSKVFAPAANLDSRVGTLAYMAPELIKSLPYDGRLIDVWSCGVVLYVMLVGKYPFGTPDESNARDKKNMMLKVANAEWQVPSEVPISAECHDLLRRILVADPKARLSMEKVMTHPWFKVNLPVGALEYNRGLLTSPPAEDHMQPVAEIRAVLGLA